MAGEFDGTAASFALKELYSDQVVNELVFTNNVFLALVPKKKDFVGEDKPLPVVIGTSQGASGDFSEALGSISPGRGRKFTLTRISDYSIARIKNEIMLAAENDKGAFLRGADLVIRGAFRTATQSLAFNMCRDGTGVRGKIAAISSGVITLADPNDALNFELDMRLQANDTYGGASPRAAKGYVTAVNYREGKITVSTSQGGSAGSPSAWAPNDYLLRSGDNNAMITGLAGWLPWTEPGSGDSFFGVDRSVHPTRLSGVRWDGSSQMISEALVSAVDEVILHGGNPNYVLVPPRSFTALKHALGTKVDIVEVKSDVGIGFSGIRIITNRGSAVVLSERNLPPGYGYVLTMDTWELDSLGDAPRLLPNLETGKLLTVSTADAGEVRVGYYGQLGNSAPGWNGVVKLP